MNKCGKCRRISIRHNDRHETILYCWKRDKPVKRSTPACGDFAEVLIGTPIRTGGKKAWHHPEQKNDGINSWERTV